MKPQLTINTIRTTRSNSEDIKIPIKPPPIIVAALEDPVHSLHLIETFLGGGHLEGVLESGIDIVWDQTSRVL